MKQEAIVILRKTLETKLGIDFEKYQSDEAMETLGELLLFPVYALKTIVSPILLIALFLFLGIGVSFYYSREFFAFLLLISLIPFSLMNGIPLGISLFLQKTSDDVVSLLIFTLDQTRQVLSDIQDLQSRHNTKQLELPKISEVMTGCIYILVLPKATAIIRKKVPLVGRLVSYCIHKIFDLLLDKLVESVDKTTEEVEAIETREGEEENSSLTLSAYCEKGIQSLEAAKNFIETLVSAVIKVIAFPFRGIFIVTATFSLCSLLFFFYVT